MVRKFWALLLCLVMVMTMMPVMVFAADSPDSTQFAGTDGLNSFNAAQAAIRLREKKSSKPAMLQRRQG